MSDMKPETHWCLFVGGPVDGWWREVEKKQPVVLIDGQTYIKFAYGHGDPFLFPIDWNPADAINRLMQGYTAQGSAAWWGEAAPQRDAANKKIREKYNSDPLAFTEEELSKTQVAPHPINELCKQVAGLCAPSDSVDNLTLVQRIQVLENEIAADRARRAKLDPNNFPPSS